MKTLIFDNETTGLLNHPNTPIEQQPHIIEFGGVLIDEDCKILDKIEKLIHPGIEISDKITQITGITNEMVKGKPDFARRYKKIKKFIEQADVMIAHNLSFDKGMVDLELKRIDKTIKWPDIQICTVELNNPKYGYFINLRSLYQDVCGKPLKQTHRAMGDVMALLDIVREGKYLETIAAATQS